LNLTWQNQISRRNGLRLLACGLVFLGVCVFAWGLRYKLSLYDPPHSVAHRMPAAKLLAGREGIEMPTPQRYRASNPAGPAVLLALTLFFGLFRSARMLPGFFRRPAWQAPIPLMPLCFAPVACWNRPPPRSH
jgi:hypothetical protein